MRTPRNRRPRLLLLLLLLLLLIIRAGAPPSAHTSLPISVVAQVVHPLRTRQCLLQLLHQLRYGQLLCSLQATQLLLVAALVPLVGLALLAVVVAAP